MNRRGQIWIETVIYTLIGIAVIGIVLGLAKPKIDEKRDEIAIEQAIASLDRINEKVVEVQNIPGNRRVINLKIGTGELLVDAVEDSIRWELPASFQYSEEGLPIPVGDINVTTVRRGGESWTVILEKKYELDLQYDGSDTTIKPFSAAPTPYNLIIENEGRYLREVAINIREA